jgi:alkanesulfonate monooxygenase SsuD/methylene tetrahydromethanopterin reductase-like flavin-dependent oxidoreductase (luciferase family)
VNQSSVLPTSASPPAFAYLVCQQTTDDSQRASLVDEIVAEAQAAETAGFCGVFVSEHHQRQDNFFPSPLVLATVLARATRRLDIGVSVALLPLYHPLRLVEDATCVDIVAKGRLILGLGPGYVPSDLHLYGIDKPEALARYLEGLEILQHGWDRNWTHEGAQYRVNISAITPRPISDPRPRIWIAANTIEGVRRAALYGDGWIIGARSTLARAEQLSEAYLSICQQLNKQPQISVIRDAWVGDSDEAAYDEVGVPLLNSHNEHVSAGFIADESMTGVDPRRSNVETFYKVATDRWLVGDRNRVQYQIGNWVTRVGASYFVVRFRHATGPSREEVLAQIARFGNTFAPDLESLGFRTGPPRQLDLSP